ncbi:hypothetical protein C8R43DRAFT_950579 [Mycena crocata]|nr:hypothetical protein C8R43DRAFT_950579 [Mycena crocata]
MARLLHTLTPRPLRPVRAVCLTHCDALNRWLAGVDINIETRLDTHLPDDQAMCEAFVSLHNEDFEGVDVTWVLSLATYHPRAGETEVFHLSTFTGSPGDPDAPLWVKRLPPRKILCFPQPREFVARLVGGMITDIPVRALGHFGTPARRAVYIRRSQAVEKNIRILPHLHSHDLHGETHTEARGIGSRSSVVYARKSRTDGVQIRAPAKRMVNMGSMAPGSNELVLPQGSFREAALTKHMQAPSSTTTTGESLGTFWLLNELDTPRKHYGVLERLFTSPNRWSRLWLSGVSITDWLPQVALAKHMSLRLPPRQRANLANPSTHCAGHSHLAHYGVLEYITTLYLAGDQMDAVRGNIMVCLSDFSSSNPMESVVAFRSVSSFLRASSTFLVTLQENNATTVMLMTTMKWAGVGGGRALASCTHGKLLGTRPVSYQVHVGRGLLGKASRSVPWSWFLCQVRHCKPVSEVRISERVSLSEFIALRSRRGRCIALSPSLTTPSGVTAEGWSARRRGAADGGEGVLWGMRIAQSASRNQTTTFRMGVARVDFSSSGSGAAQYRNEELWCRWRRGEQGGLKGKPGPLRPVNTRSKSKVKLNDGPHWSASDVVEKAAKKGATRSGDPLKMLQDRTDLKARHFLTTVDVFVAEDVALEELLAWPKNTTEERKKAQMDPSLFPCA